MTSKWLIEIEAKGKTGVEFKWVDIDEAKGRVCCIRIFLCHIAGSHSAGKRLTS